MKKWQKFFGIFLIVVTMSSIPVFAGSSSIQTAQVNVGESIAITASWCNYESGSMINLGNLVADNTEDSWIGGSTGEQVETCSNCCIDLYVKASGDFTNHDTGGTILLANFCYGGYADSMHKNSFTTEYAKTINNWQKCNPGETRTVPISLYLTVPFGTEPGIYTTTVYHSAVKHGTPGPV